MSWNWMKNANAQGVCVKCGRPVDDHTWKDAEAIVQGKEPIFRDKPQCPGVKA